MRYMPKNSLQKSETLRLALNYVSHICNEKTEFLLYGGKKLEKKDTFESLDHKCFLYEFNKSYSSNYKGLIRKSRLRNIIYGYNDPFSPSEAKCFADFLFHYLKEHAKTDDKEQILENFRPYLKKILIKHNTKNDFFDVDSYLDNLYGIPENERKSKAKLFIIKDAEVTEEDIKQALELDLRYYQNHIKDSEQFTLQKCIEWNEKANFRIYTMLKDNDNQILGYINAVSISKKCYEEIRDGTYPDADIDSDSILKFSRPGEYNLYFASILIDEEKQRGKNYFIPLFNGFIEKLIRLAKDEDIAISKIIADAVSNEGKQICEGLGMSKIKDTEHDDSSVYELQLYPPKFDKKISSKIRELHNIYSERFKQLGNDES